MPRVRAAWSPATDGPGGSHCVWPDGSERSIYFWWECECVSIISVNGEYFRQGGEETALSVAGTWRAPHSLRGSVDVDVMPPLVVRSVFDVLVNDCSG